eukprot:1232734-Amphidinium_carterae.2
MGGKKRRMAREAAAKSQAQNKEMSLPRVSENDVMEMDVTSASDIGGVSYASVTSGTTAASSSSGTSWSWQASKSSAAFSGAATSGWTDWQADVQTDGDPDPRVKALPGR